MTTNRIDRAVRDAQHALEIARMRKDKRGEARIARRWRVSC